MPVFTRDLVLGAATLLFCSPLLVGSLRGQQGQAPPPGGSVQVAVPEGRGGGQPLGRRGGGPPPGPAPRGADGRVTLTSAQPSEKGVWLPGRGGAQTPEAQTQIPFQPWARAVYADRENNQLEPHTRCKPSGGVRQFLTPYGVEIVELAELQQIFIFDIGGPHTYRTVFLDGRTHPAQVDPKYYGHSIGWWDGDTLVVDTTGFNEGFWIDRRGLPTTTRLHTLERFTRTDSATIKYELTIDDPGAYTAPWTSGFDLRWEAGTELFEYVCQQANYAHELMVGQFESVDRTTITVP